MRLATALLALLLWLPLASHAQQRLWLVAQLEPDSSAYHMVGAFALDFWESRDLMTAEFLPILAIGFVVSFISGLFVVRFLVDFVGRYGFAPFSAWRILVGTVGLLGIWLYA